MPVAETALLVGAGVLGVGALTWWLLGSSALSQADKDKAAFDAGYKSGCARGDADGKAKKVALLKPDEDPTFIAESKSSLSPASYLQGVNKGYLECFVAAAPVVIKESNGGGGGGGKVAWKPPGPPSGLPDAMREGETAYSYGCRRGKQKAREDVAADKEGDPTSPLSTGGSIKRQAESGDGEAYKAGFENCYGAEFAKLMAAKAAEEVLPFSSSSFGAIVLGPDAIGERQFFATRPRYRPAFAA
jgi:hypothetical protein